MDYFYGLVSVIVMLIVWVNILDRKRLRAMTAEQREKEIQEIRDEGMGGA